MNKPTFLPAINCMILGITFFALSGHAGRACTSLAVDCYSPTCRLLAWLCFGVAATFAGVTAFSLTKAFLDQRQSRRREAKRKAAPCAG
jgi:hypothetical protein